MKISNKLMIIVLLTAFEISLTLWSVFEIAKGATFHQLNFLHLKYNATFSDEILRLENGELLDIPLLKNNINNIRQQPVECLLQVSALNKMIMRQIGTFQIIELCEKDIRDADRALDLLNQYTSGQLHYANLISELKMCSQTFNATSILFEEPTIKTVTFVMRTMIPLVIFISLFNILFITFMSQNITSSIDGVIQLLSKTNSKEDLETDINKNVSGELKTLLEVAKQRITNELMVTEVNQKLEALVEQRTFSLTRANDELAQFAYRASHDLKAPLTSTKMLAQFIIQDINEGQLQNALDDAEKIVKQMIKLEQLVIGILALTEADSIDQGVKDIDFQEILTEVCASTSDLLAENDCIFEQKITLTQPMKAEKIRLLQIIENLVTNAIKYHDPNKERAFVKTTVLEKHNSYVVQVEDNGLGIPENRRSEVFQMFKRFHPKVSFGSGLGMAIVKKHVDYMQGTIDMTTSNKGTIFTISFPKGKSA
ncbi:sensor histidine kinase [Paraglaciecola arctica]|uniref:histidine kinase n=1 Tax=Paraglaciecola arctica BSs20135 TaxID=493475 RepID=K6XHA6_9ALTE|nr:HAMP domain-containing sensor histidine kinase [Paraglaciecola arctica]GAC20034.1 periplasmic sensor signal transduction histidine kinase [Paraglaciecola arctica BSs20135]